MRLLTSPNFYFRRAWLSCFSGILAGLAAAVFLITLEWATEARERNPYLIWFLPLAGLFIGLMYVRFAGDASRGHNLVIDEIHNPKKIVPARMAPFVLVGTILTHLFGGSAGREGTAVQMGASLSDQLGRFFKIDQPERKVLLAAGAGAGFGAAIGTPFAGVIFGMEAISIGPLNLFALYECSISSFIAYWIVHWIGAPHSHFQSFTGESFSFTNVLIAALAGVLFGMAARLFVAVTHFVESILVRLIPRAEFRPFVGGILLIVLYNLEGSFRYVGLGISVIQQSINGIVGFNDPTFKTLFTALTIGSGFKGGEFVPLVFIGATLGSALSFPLPSALAVLSRVGFSAVFAGASNTPIACSIMAIELFGASIAPYAIVGCFMSYFVSGSTGIYKAQRLVLPKHRRPVEALQASVERCKNILRKGKRPD